MNWQCLRCETFNRAAEKQCEVCESAKPPKRISVTKTAVKNTSLTFLPPDSARSGALTKPEANLSVKIIGFDALTERAGDDVSVASKSLAPSEVLTPPDVQLDKNISPNTAFILFLLLIVGNIYLVYDFTIRREMGVGSWVLGMVFGNIVLFMILGIVAQFIIRVTNSSKPPE